MIIDWPTVSVLILGYMFTFITSTLLVRKTINFLDDRKYKFELDTGFVIGICENFIVLTFIIANEVTGLALIFAAKTIVRRKDIEENAKYYLAGTMVNFTFSVFMGMVIKYVVLSM